MGSSASLVIRYSNSSSGTHIFVKLHGVMERFTFLSLKKSPLLFPLASVAISRSKHIATLILQWVSNALCDFVSVKCDASA